MKVRRTVYILKDIREKRGKPKRLRLPSTATHVVATVAAVAEAASVATPVGSALIRRLRALGALSTPPCSLQLLVAPCTSHRLLQRQTIVLLPLQLFIPSRDAHLHRILVTCVARTLLTYRLRWPDGCGRHGGI